MLPTRTPHQIAVGAGIGACLALTAVTAAHAAPGPGYDLHDDHATTTVDTPVQIYTLANDEWSFPAELHGWFDSLQNPTAQGGTVVDQGYGVAVYTPPPGFTGTDTFEYGRTEYLTGAYSDTATVTITVTAQDDPAVPAIAPGTAAGIAAGAAAVGLVGGGRLLDARRRARLRA